MKFAIIQASGTQYKVSEGDTITIDYAAVDEKKNITFSDVLMIAENTSVSIGAPYLPGATVTGSVITHKKGKKIRVATYKSKSRTRRVTGHRSHLSEIKITSIAKKKVSQTDSSKGKK